MNQQSIKHAFIINNFEELILALKDSDKNIITTSEDAIYYMGLLYIEQMLELASKNYEDVYKRFLLNTKDNAAICHLALKGKIKYILFTGNEEMFLKLAAIAGNLQKTLYFIDKSKNY
jgi:hypothetical protein